MVKGASPEEGRGVVYCVEEDQIGRTPLDGWMDGCNQKRTPPPMVLARVGDGNGSRGSDGLEV